MRHVYDTFSILSTFGISAQALLTATTNDPDAVTPSVVGPFQSALRARYGQADWLNVIQPINDELRELSRDALVAYILQHLALYKATSQYNTVDSLYEYLLVDTQMEPCQQTLRIRLALSSVQLFIERCLMNLEPQVDASYIDQQQWEWMKQYRVWQANREVFLWPENWLEPELRDDQSSMFTSTMSQLLQSDITDDSAASALQDYLSQLELIAKLEPSGLYYDETTTPPTTYAVARSSGVPRKYYYRQCVGASWTPWEETKLDIEDNPVLPVVWNGRLLLFWLRIIPQTQATPVAASSTDTTQLAAYSLTGIQAAATGSATASAPQTSQVNIQVVLCYSEYYNGKWQPTRTSDLLNPPSLGTFAAPGASEGLAFDRSNVQLGSHLNSAMYADPQRNSSLQINVSTSSADSAQFILCNTHSVPYSGPAPMGFVIDSPSCSATTSLQFPTSYYGIPTSYDWALTLSYSGGSQSGYSGGSQPGPFTILTDQIAPSNPLQPAQDLPDSWQAPFFFFDSQYAFYVEQAYVTTTTIKTDYYGVPFSVAASATLPPIVLRDRIPPSPIIPDPIGPGPYETNPGVIATNPAEQLVARSDNFSTVIATTGAFTYDNETIGALGDVAGSGLATGAS